MADELTRPLEWVAITTTWNPDDREARDDAICAAYEAGTPLRLVADYTGAWHQAVHKIVRDRAAAPRSGVPAGGCGWALSVPQLSRHGIVTETAPDGLKRSEHAHSSTFRVRSSRHDARRAR
jgi:hypothetical protein